MLRVIIPLCALLAAAPAEAAPKDGRQTFALGADVGAGGRYVDHLAVSDPDSIGLGLGARAEVNALLHLRGDLQYIDGRLFRGEADDRMFAVSAAARTPKLFIFALDLHELYWRTSTRPGDRLTYAHAGLGLVGDLLGTLKGSLGFTYVAADDVHADQLQRGYGAYAGLEYLVRIKFLQASVRGTVFVVFAAEEPVQSGAMVDGDLMIPIPAGPVGVGPRLDIAYRNLGLGQHDLFGEEQEVTATLGLGVVWGTGTGKVGRRDRGDDDRGDDRGSDT